MPTYFCAYCGRETTHLNVSAAAALAQVTRRTVYAWIKRHGVHCVHRPSGRKFVCSQSLVIGEEYLGFLAPPRSAIGSEPVRGR